MLAVEDGLIGSQIGPLDSTDPHLLGLRLHLVSPRMEYYYAHLSRLDVHAGDTGAPRPAARAERIGQRLAAPALRLAPRRSRAC